MTRYPPWLCMLCLVTACHDDPPLVEDEAPIPVELDGSAQKGPLLAGSSIQGVILDRAGRPTGAVYATRTIDDAGRFRLRLDRASPVELVASGFHFDEARGVLSGAPITLHAIVDSAAVQNVFVNVLTEMATGRIRRLMEGGATVAQATDEAGRELRTALGIFVAPSDPSTRLDLLGGDSVGNAYLLGVSCVLGHLARDGARSDAEVDAELQQLVNRVGLDLEADGVLDAALTTRIRDAAQRFDPFGCSTHLQQRFDAIGTPAVVPNIARVLDWDRDGVPDARDPDADGDGVPAAADIPTSVNLVSGYVRAAGPTVVLGDPSGAVWWTAMATGRAVPPSGVGDLLGVTASPQQALRDVVQVTGNGDLSLALTRAGSLLLWHGTEFGSAQPIPGAQGIATTARALAFGAVHEDPSSGLPQVGHARLTDGRLLAVDVLRRTASVIEGVSGVRRVSSAAMFRGWVLLQLEDGTVATWGGDSEPQLIRAAGLTGIVDVVGAQVVAYALDGEHRVHSISLIDQLNGSTEPYQPHRIESLTGVTALFGELPQLTGAIAADDAGRLWLLQPETPILMATLPDVVVAASMIYVGGSRTQYLGIAVTRDGSVWWFGFNNIGLDITLTSAPRRIYLPR